MKILKIILCICTIQASVFSSLSQTIERFNAFSYNVNEGLLQSTLADMAFDKNNFGWISFPNGIQKFDGKNFTTVPVQPGLPDDKFVVFFQSKNGDLFLSHSQGISKYEITANRFVQVYNNTTAVKKPARFIGEDDNIIFFYTQTGNITGINSRNFKTVSETKAGFWERAANSDYIPIVSNNIINHRIAIQAGHSLYLWDLQKKKLLYQSDSIPNISPYLVTLKTGDEVLYYTYKINNALQCYNFTTKTNKSIFIKGKHEEYISRCVIFPWHKKILLSLSGKLYEADESLQVLRSELVNFQNQPIAGAASIWGIRADNFGNLYLLTVTGGIRKIIRNNYPVKYYGTEKKEQNFVLGIFPDKQNNRIFSSTANGLLIFDTLQKLIRQIKTLPGRSAAVAPNNIIKTKTGNYLLFISGENHVWQLSHDLSALTSIPILSSIPENKRGIHYFGNFLFQNEKEVLVQSQARLYRVNFTTNTAIEHEVTTSYTMSGLWYNNMIITHANDELIYLDAATLKEIKRVPFKNTGYVRCFARDAANNIYLGCNKGIFKIDSAGKILEHLTKENGLPDECIYAMVFDKDGFLWSSTNKGIFKLNRDNSILQLKKEDGLQENEFNTNMAAISEDGELFFGGVNGVSSFYPEAISSFEEKINLLVTQVKVNNEERFKDIATWNMEKIKLPYDQNALSFDFVAMASNNPEQYIYQYKMDGMDKEWIQNSGLQTVRYSLPPGEYVFKIYASRFFDKDAKPMKEIRITINPPFWKTWWFIGGMILLMFVGLAYGVNRYNKRKYQKKLMELESEHKIQLERERISRDLHDNIGAYANAVLYSTELLQKEESETERRELMNDLKFASKDIITSLRETIWALKNENYTPQECLLRIKNFIQPFTRYYAHIHFRVEGEASAEKILHYTTALNIVRLVQEAVNNAIKHASPANIKIVSKDKNGRWQLTVENDGNGFNYETMKDSGQGNGLLNMKQRAAESGFEFSVRSDLHTGTTVCILI